VAAWKKSDEPCGPPSRLCLSHSWSVHVFSICRVIRVYADCAVACCDVLWRAVLCCAVACCAVLCYAVQQLDGELDAWRLNDVDRSHRGGLARSTTASQLLETCGALREHVFEVLYGLRNANVSAG
jgi:hypothetical protein